MTTPPLVSVVLPCRNQADHIGHILPRYAEALDRAGIPFELIVVPNASNDGTELQVRALAMRDARVRCMENPDGGWGRSVRIGLNAARGEVLVYTNTARTDPEGLPDFIRSHLERPQTLVKAARRQRNAWRREVGSWLYNLEARILFGIRCADINGTPKVFSRTLYSQLVLKEDGDLLDLELIAQATRLKVPIRDVPTFGFKRHSGKSSTTLRSAWRMYSGGFRLRFSAPRPVTATLLVAGSAERSTGV
jgi:glycosyltransferase involved in cell wall biosynthesis